MPPKKRRCPLCNRVFELPDPLDLQLDKTLHCPTPNCRGTSDMWVHPGNPLTSEEAWRDWERMTDWWEKHHGQDDVAA
ncbi:MAG: hypothetical protein ABIT76_01835 [Chthoniobacterales bacterium]